MEILRALLGDWEQSNPAMYMEIQTSCPSPPYLLWKFSGVSSGFSFRHKISGTRVVSSTSSGCNKGKEKRSKRQESNSEDDLEISGDALEVPVEICLDKLDDKVRRAAKVGCKLSVIHDEEIVAKKFRDDFLEEKKAKGKI